MHVLEQPSPARKGGAEEPESHLEAYRLSVQRMGCGQELGLPGSVWLGRGTVPSCGLDSLWKMEAWASAEVLNPG